MFVGNCGRSKSSGGCHGLKWKYVVVGMALYTVVTTPGGEVDSSGQKSRQREENLDNG